MMNDLAIYSARSPTSTITTAVFGFPFAITMSFKNGSAEIRNLLHFNMDIIKRILLRLTYHHYNPGTNCDQCHLFCR